MLQSRYSSGISIVNLILYSSIALSIFISQPSLTAAIEYTSEALADKIIGLPGQVGPQLSNQFSGYFQISDSKHIHYMYFESENDPVNDPLFFWTNGGPGCSGLLGLFTEFGPWRPLGNGTVVSNPFSFTKKSSFVFLEQPAGVGFSYTTIPQEKHGYNDFKAARDNLLTLKKFFARFPEKANTDFYITSESYGGHYIPHLALSILNDVEELSAPAASPHPGTYLLSDKFRGFFLGNAYTSFASGSIAGALVEWGLQLVPKPSWDMFASAGCADLSHDAWKYPDACWDRLDDLDSYTEMLNPYALDFPVCVGGEGLTANTPSPISGSARRRDLLLRSKSKGHQSAQAKYLKKLQDRIRTHVSQSRKETQAKANTAGIEQQQRQGTQRQLKDAHEPASPHTHDISTPSTDAGDQSVGKVPGPIRYADIYAQQIRDLQLHHPEVKKERSEDHISMQSTEKSKDIGRDFVRSEYLHEGQSESEAVPAAATTEKENNKALDKNQEKTPGRLQDKSVRSSRVLSDKSSSLPVSVTAAVASTMGVEARLLDRDENIGDENKSQAKVQAKSEAMTEAMAKAKAHAQDATEIPYLLEYNPCTEDFTVDYLRRVDVQKALNVFDALGMPDGFGWAVCDDDVFGDWSLSDDLADTTHLYSLIFAHPRRAPKFRMLVFSGDSDGVCATIGTQNWIYSIEGAQIRSLYQPWSYTDYHYPSNSPTTMESSIQQGGFLTMFNDFFSFATVHYAGHEVPAYQPQRAMELFTRFLDGSAFVENPNL